MTFANAVGTCFRKYATFSGRASRSEFWYFILFLFVSHVFLIVANTYLFGPQVSQTIGSVGQGGASANGIRYSYNGGVLGLLFSLAVLLPWLAVSWRRMHDSGRSGLWPWLIVAFWLFFSFFAVFSASAILILVCFSIGFLVMLAINSVYFSWPSDPKTNSYGPPPHVRQYTEEVFE